MFGIPAHIILVLHATGVHRSNKTQVEKFPFALFIAITFSDSVSFPRMLSNPIGTIFPVYSTAPCDGWSCHCVKHTISVKGVCVCVRERVWERGKVTEPTYSYRICSQFCRFAVLQGWVGVHKGGPRGYMIPLSLDTREPRDYTYTQQAFRALQLK